MRLLSFMLIFSIIFSANSIAQQANCDYGVKVVIDSNESDSQNFTWKVIAAKIEGAPTKITGTAKIEDFNGKMVKSYRPWTSEPISVQKTSGEYTPNLKPGTYKITAEINVGCDDINERNNIDIEKIKIKNNENEKSAGKPDGEVPESEYKKAGIESQDNASSSKQTDFEADEEKTIHLNSNNKNEDIMAQAKDSPLKKFGIAYESSSEKSKGLILLSLLAVSILLNIILIWKR